MLPTIRILFLAIKVGNTESEVQCNEKSSPKFLVNQLSNPAELVFNKLSFKDVFKYEYVLYFEVYSALNLNSP